MPLNADGTMEAAFCVIEGCRKPRASSRSLFCLECRSLCRQSAGKIGGQMGTKQQKRAAGMVGGVRSGLKRRGAHRFKVQPECIRMSRAEAAKARLFRVEEKRRRSEIGNEGVNIQGERPCESTIKAVKEEMNEMPISKTYAQQNKPVHGVDLPSCRR